MIGLLHTCDISRKQAVGTNGRRAVSVLASGVQCLAIPMNARTSVENQFEIGKGYDFYFEPGQDVRVGDKLTFADDSFSVRSIEAYDVPVAGHIHALAEREVA